MKANVWVVTALALAAFPVSAADTATPKPTPNKEIAATFVAEAKGNNVSVYSNSKKARHCEIFVAFSVIQGGKRVPGNLRCFEKDLPAGDHVLVCDVNRPEVVDPKIESAVDGSCK